MPLSTSYHSIGNWRGHWTKAVFTADPMPQDAAACCGVFAVHVIKFAYDVKTY